MEKIRINLFELLECISNVQDLVSSKLSNHHQQVAYLALRISEQLGLSSQEKNDIFQAALIHDIGALSVKERIDIIDSKTSNTNIHAFRGAKLLQVFKPLRNSAKIIKYHHIPWNNGEGSTYKGEDVPLASHIIHLADRTSAFLCSECNVISKIPEILSIIRKQENSLFKPELVDALCELRTKEFIWLDMISSKPTKMISNVGLLSPIELKIDDIIDFSLVSRIIDFRSRFTARHSAGVAKTAERLAQLIGFSPYECKMMLVAGYLHDLGKIAISDDILEKPGKLTLDQSNEMRAHTYYTYHSLEPLAQLNTINAWASYHHEKLDGTGYPFHISGNNLLLGSRIMAVADVFTAITEDRPYRKGMDFANAKNVLLNMIKSNALDDKVVNLLLENYQEINNVRENSQIEAALQYKNFLVDK